MAVAKKKEAVVKKEDVKKTTATTQDTAEKAKTTTTRKKKTTKGAKRGPKPASERTVNFVVQFGESEVTYDDLVGRVKDMWKERGKRETSLKTLDIYVKPEERKAYYVINAGTKGQEDGDFDY